MISHYDLHRKLKGVLNDVCQCRWRFWRERRSSRLYSGRGPVISRAAETDRLCASELKIPSATGRAWARCFCNLTSLDFFYWLAPRLWRYLNAFKPLLQTLHVDFNGLMRWVMTPCLGECVRKARTTTTTKNFSGLLMFFHLIYSTNDTRRISIRALGGWVGAVAQPMPSIYFPESWMRNV